MPVKDFHSCIKIVFVVPHRKTPLPRIGYGVLMDGFGPSYILILIGEGPLGAPLYRALELVWASEGI